MSALIWSERRGAWWRAGGDGYCTDLGGAGVYEDAAADAITRRGASVAVPVSDEELVELRRCAELSRTICARRDRALGGLT